MFKRGPTSFSIALGVAGLATVLFSFGCGSSAKPGGRDGGPDSAVEPEPDAGAADQVPDGAPDDDVPPGDARDATSGDVRDAAVLADASEDSPDDDDDDAAVVDSGPDLPPVHGPLLAHWPLDEGTGTATADATGNGGGATLVSGATWATPGFPAAQFANPGAVVLDGIDDYVELGVRAIPSHEAPKTVSLWFYQDVPSTVGRKNIIALTDFADSGVGTQIGLDAGRASVWFTDDMVGMIDSPAQVAAGWHHLAYTYEGGVNRFYLDMQLLGEVTRVAAPAPVARAFLGGFDLITLEKFAGRVDDVRIYDSALDAAAIAVLVAGNTP
jgi:hypothetical protein